MLQYNIPQFVDTEDKVIGPLTLRQFAYLVIGAVIIGFLWVFKANLLTFIITATPVAAIAMAFAFLKVYSQDFGTFMSNVLLFVINPSVYVWKRSGREAALIISTKVKRIAKVDWRKEKGFSQNRVAEIAWTLDTYGQKTMDPNLDPSSD
jgi:hypothetical protein